MADIEPQATPKLREQTIALETRLNEVSLLLRGNPEYSERTLPGPPSVVERVRGVSGTMRGASNFPTQTALDSYAIASDEFKNALGKLRTLAREEMPRLETALDRAGVPYTPGRLPDWKE